MKFEEIKTEEVDDALMAGSFELKNKLDYDTEILANFDEEQQKLIKDRQKQLSSLAYFIGKDFDIPVVLGVPSQECPSGWMWAKRADGSRFIQMNVFDLATKPMDYLRFVISHEGGHARISHMDFIPMETWKQKGFSFLINAIEDPRDNNFVADNYPRFAEQMKLAYEQDEEVEKTAKEKAKATLGYQPRFMQAGFEYIKQWYKERLKEKTEVTEGLPPEVKEIVIKTLPSASDAWWRYPTKKEADESDKNITAYAKVVYEIILEEIWPEFQKLVEKDMEDQKMSEFMKDLEEKKKDSIVPRDLSDKLTPEEKKELEEAIEKATTSASEGHSSLEKEEKGEGKEGRPKAVDIDSLSPELKKKIKDFIDGLPDDKKKELAEKAEKAIEDFEKEINKEIEGKLAENPEQKDEKEKKDQLEIETESDNKDGGKKKETPESAEEKEKTAKALKKVREDFEKIANQDSGVYDQTYEEVSGIINRLTNELRNVFRDRQKEKMQTGKKSGSRINIGRRITELAERILPIESRAWERRGAPEEKDYAVSLLVDLSGSMTSGGKIEETFKAVVALVEVLNKIGIKTEILGFNDRIHDYLSFGEKLTKNMRDKMPQMLQEVSSSRARYNDDGWALEQASNRLASQNEQVKILISLSDGLPEPSEEHSGWDLSEVVKTVSKNTKIKLIGLGIGSGTSHVSSYYPKSIADVSVGEMAEQLAEVVKEAIVNY